MKRIQIALACIAFMFGAAARAVPIVSIETTAPTASVGDSVVVSVDIAGALDLYGIQFDLGFDPTLLSFTGGTPTEGAFLPSGGTTLFVGGTDNGAGAIIGTFESLVGAIPGVSGTGTLATFVFTAIGTGVSALTLANVLGLDSNLNVIDAGTSDGFVTVQEAISVPEPRTIALLGVALAGAGFMGRRRGGLGGTCGVR